MGVIELIPDSDIARSQTDNLLDGKSNNLTVVPPSDPYSNLLLTIQLLIMARGAELHSHYSRHTEPDRQQTETLIPVQSRVTENTGS